MPVNITQDYSSLLALLDRPIAFHRVFVTVTGSVLAGLMLSQGVYWHPRGSAADNWFWKTQAEWKEETGMSRPEQETARRKLRQVKTEEGVHIWEEELRGVPAKMHYRVNISALFQCIVEVAPQYAGFQHTSMLDSDKQVGGNPADLNAAIPQTLYTETTTDINAKSKKRATRTPESRDRRNYRPDEYKDIILG